MSGFQGFAKRTGYVVALLALVAGGASALGNGRLNDQQKDVLQRLELAAKSSPVLVMGGVVVSQAELDAHMAKLPEADRARAVSNIERIDNLLQSLLLKKVLYQAARASGLPEEPTVAFRAIGAAADVLADEQMERHVQAQLLDNYEQQARELYLTDPERFATGQNYDFTHVLISTAKRDEDEAMRLILDLHDRVEKGESLDALAAEYTDDEASREASGAYENHPLNRLDRNFARALAQLENPGDVTGPVRSRFGWHLIRLDKRYESKKPEWEDARDQAIELARQRHAERIRKAYIAELIDSDAIEVVPGSIERFQKRHGYDAEKARQALQNAETED